MTSELVVFTEIFPIHLEALPELTLYQLEVNGSAPLDEIGRKVGYRLQTKFGNHWNWDKVEKYLITDCSQQVESSLSEVLQEIWKTSTEEDILRSLEKIIKVSPNHKAANQGIADFVASSLQNDFSRNIKKALEEYRREENTYYVHRRCDLRGWTVDNHPAISVSINSELEYKGDLRKYIASSGHNDLLGLHVKDKTKPSFQNSMKITGIVGKLGENNTRVRLLAFKPHPDMKRMIEQAPDDELVVKLNDKYD